MEEVQQIKDRLAEDRPERWESLPDIELYMDQLVSYLPRQSVGGKVPAMTSAMINNYVKDGLLPRANGKRYRKEHLVYLTAVGLLKSVLTVKDMKLLMGRVVQEGEEQAFYEALCQGVDDAFLAAEESIPADLPEEYLTTMAMRLALTSCAAKTACEQLLAVVREREPEEDPKARKEREKEAARQAKAVRKAEKNQEPAKE